MPQSKKNIVGERIALLREGIGASQEEFAEMIGLQDRTQVHRYEKGTSIPKKSRLAKIADITNTTVSYIRGETNTRDPILYYEELRNAEDAGLADLEIERLSKIERIKSLFNLCGFKYENIESTAQYEFDGATGPKEFNGPHKIMDPQEINDIIYLSDEELKALQERLGDTVAFECFRIKRGRDKENGNG